MTIGFIGLGNMAKAMIGGMLDKNIATKENIIGSAKTKETREAVAAEFSIEVFADNRDVAKRAEVLILAIKPQFFGEVLPEIKDAVKKDALIISIAAGKSMQEIEGFFGRKIKMVRCMPNTPALVGEGCSAVCFNEKVSEEEKALCRRLIGSFGMAEEIPERLIDAFAGVSGCSPAFVFQFLEALADGGVAAGLPRKQAYAFAAQAVMGSAKLMLESGKHPGELKDMVCSPGGTTIEGVRVLEERGFRGAIMDAVKATVEKTQKL